MLERQGIDQVKICNILQSLYLRLNAGKDNDLARLVDVLKLDNGLTVAPVLEINLRAIFGCNCAHGIVSLCKWV